MQDMAAKWRRLNRPLKYAVSNRHGTERYFATKREADKYMRDEQPTAGRQQCGR